MSVTRVEVRGWVTEPMRVPILKHSIVITSIDTCIYSATHAHALVHTEVLIRKKQKSVLTIRQLRIFGAFVTLDKSNDPGCRVGRRRSWHETKSYFFS